MFKVFPVYFTFIASSIAISSAGFLIGLIGTMYTLQITPMGDKCLCSRKAKNKKYQACQSLDMLSPSNILFIYPYGWG